MPEEHIFIHFLRWKVFGHDSDLFAVNFMINGFLNKEHISSINLNRMGRTQYSLQRRKFGELIKRINSGNKKIGKRLRGKMFAIDGESGEKNWIS